MTLGGLESPIQFNRTSLSSPLSKFANKNPLDASETKPNGARKPKKRQGLILDVDTSLTNAEIRAMQSSSNESILSSYSVSGIIIMTFVPW
jgi:hypothetical protein